MAYQPLVVFNSKSSLYIYYTGFVLLLLLLVFIGGARGVMVIVVGNEHGDTSSNPGQDLLHFTKH